MSHDNAAIDTVSPVGIDGDYSALTDRELLERIARNMDAVLIIAAGVQEQVAPVLNSPMLKMFRK